MNIFRENPDFFPTPTEVIEKMLMNEDIIGKTVLEPSAGSGNIVRYLQKCGAREVIACEKDQNIRKLLGNACNIIAEDFLAVTSEMVSHVDYIVMNPPFSRGVSHIMHAYSIAPSGCTIIALCNTDSVSSGHYYRENRELCELITLNGQQERLGRVFQSAERTTDVDVTLIKLYKPNTAESEFDGYFFSEDEHEDDCTGAEGIVRYDVVREIVGRYVSAVKMFDTVMDMSKRINATAKYTDYSTDGNGSVFERDYGFLPITFGAIREAENLKHTEITHNVYKKELQKYYWRIIFKKLNMEKYATKQLREQINKFIEQNENTPFTMANIYKVVNIVVQTHSQRMGNALIEAFDMVCSFSAENSTAGETWKTNANYMVNRKFIVPGITSHDARWPRDYVDTSYCYHTFDKIEDLCKALCFITGRDYDEIVNLRTHIWNTKPAWGEWFEWSFFRCKGFKKGTMHFEFLDEDVWFKFNYECSKLKGWNLPKKSKKK